MFLFLSIKWLEKLKGQETVDRPCPEEEGDLDSDIVPFVRLPWAEAEIFFEPQTGSGLRSPVPSSQEAWVAYALFFSISVCFFIR